MQKFSWFFSVKNLFPHGSSVIKKHDSCADWHHREGTSLPAARQYVIKCSKYPLKLHMLWLQSYSAKIWEMFKKLEGRELHSLSVFYKTSKSDAFCYHNLRKIELKSSFVFKIALVLNHLKHHFFDLYAHKFLGANWKKQGLGIFQFQLWAKIFQS